MAQKHVSQRRQSKRNPRLASTSQKHLLVSAAADWDGEKHLRIRAAKNPLPNGSLGDIGVVVRITGPDEFPTTILKLPVESRALTGIDAASVRMFRWDEDAQALAPVWNSGINTALGFIWSKIHRPGIYVAIGLPRDRLLQQALLDMDRQRQLADTDSAEALQAITQRALEFFIKTPEADLEELRQFTTQVEIQTGLGPFTPAELRRGGGANFLPFSLPGDASLKEFRARLAKLRAPRGGLPEEALFFPPEVWREGEPPWPRPDIKWDGANPRALDRLHILHGPEIVRPIPPWFFSQDWWMYHHDEEHTGHASGSSNINSTNVGTLIRL